MKKLLTNNIKNIGGWTTKRKLLLFAVDDYGNIRLHSRQARDRMLAAGVALNVRFDHLDALDSRIDYEYLFEVLDSFRDRSGHPALFTTYALSCNADYEKTLAKGSYEYEALDKTYERLSLDFPESYNGAYELLLEGIRKRLLRPQFHGREHINVQVFNALLRDGNASMKVNLSERCMAGLPMHPEYPGVEFNQAFAFWKAGETDLHRKILIDGLEQFKKVYGYPSKTFTPPAQQLHPALYGFVCNNGISGVDKMRAIRRHLGEGKFIWESNRMGNALGTAGVTVVRNCVFEPNDRAIDWVGYTLSQIRAAFFWGKPAVISSHRVNYCGHIDAENRRNGLEVLRTLLAKIIREFPDVEFIGVDELVEMMLGIHDRSSGNY